MVSSREEEAELAQLVPGSWLLIKLWVWIGMVWEGSIKAARPQPFQGRVETGHGSVH